MARIVYLIRPFFKILKTVFNDILMKLSFKSLTVSIDEFLRPTLFTYSVNLLVLTAFSSTNENRSLNVLCLHLEL